MHRSGTSLLTATLQALGVELPGGLIPADRHNPEGYFEWEELVRLQERLLIDLDRWWPSAQGALSLPEDWLNHPSTQIAHRQLAGLLNAAATGIQAPCWAIKDPRTSRLLPLWLRVASELDVPLRLVLAVRDPAEVVRSLVQRDGPTTGMNINRAQILWWRFTLEPLQAAGQSLPITLIHYDDWFSQPNVQLQTLLDVMPELRPTPDQCHAALDLVRPEHRRSVSHGPERLNLHARVIRLHRALRNPGQGPFPPADPPSTLRDDAAPPSAARLAREPAGWPAWLKHWRHHPAPRLAGGAALAERARIRLNGLTFTQPVAHLWLQRLPLSNIAASRILDNPEESGELHLETPPAAKSADGLAHITINLNIPPPKQARHWLDQLQSEQAIWDPDPARVCLMRALGLPAHWLDREAAANGWLSQTTAASPTSWSSHLGMAPPTEAALIVLGHGGVDWNRALAKESKDAAARPAASRQQPWSIDYRPGWYSLRTTTLNAALAHAGWLAAAARQSYALIWIQADREAWIPLLKADAGAHLLMGNPLITPTKLRTRLTPRSAQCLAEGQLSSHRKSAHQRRANLAVLTELFNADGPFHAALYRLRSKLTTKLQLAPRLLANRIRTKLTPAAAKALAEDRPSPPTQSLFEWCSAAEPTVAVLVTLFNYSERILDALNSVAQQQQQLLELIVVDDASYDDGAERVKAWMQDQIAAERHPFAKLKLVRHAHNGGLATARNTGFHLAQAAWCFVLDADNILYPEALSACLALAEAGPDALAVVHPIIAVETEPGMVDEHHCLVATAAWQREVLAQGNVVDAMALVRRSAWASVGGFTHIEGGWEDYDFWCKLIARGWHGVQYPMVLAQYRRHANSMSATVTYNSLPTLGRTLQSRHPWLQLT